MVPLKLIILMNFSPAKDLNKSNGACEMLNTYDMK